MRRKELVVASFSVSYVATFINIFAVCNKNLNFRAVPVKKEILHYLPNVQLIGAQKAGTTAVAEFLFSHGVCFGNKNPGDPFFYHKEIHFFNVNDRYKKGIEFYAERYVHCFNATSIAENEGGDTKFAKKLAMDATPNSLSRWRRIRDTYDKAGGRQADNLKILLIVREPISRLMSLYNHMIDTDMKQVQDGNGGVLSFEKYAEKTALGVDTKDGTCSLPGVHSDECYGLYAQHLRGWLSVFRRDQILVLSYDELKNDDTLLLKRVQLFLGMEGGVDDKKAATTVKNKRENVAMKSLPCSVQKTLARAFNKANQDMYNLLETSIGPPMEQRPFPKFVLSKCNATGDERNDFIFQNVGMVSVKSYLVGTIYMAPITLLGMYSLSKWANIYRAVLSSNFFTAPPEVGGMIVPGNEPDVTVQICVYNEPSVIESTIAAACNLDWPQDKLHVQVLDDSTDENAIAAVEETTCRWREENGIDCWRLTRGLRLGYKAGNLHHNFKSIKGDFVAIFDSDHRCHPQFLRRAIPHFFDTNGTSNKVGLVQAPWAYYNTHQNVLTEYDALQLDTHHVIEQQGRYGGLGCFGFNGTGGIWRTSAIQDAGGWQLDTITEDLDLSYMAVLAGYNFVYLRDIPQQLELPPGFLAHRVQKQRWTKGFFQVYRKSLRKLLRSPLPLLIKIEVFFHVTGPLSYIFKFWAIIWAPLLPFTCDETVLRFLFVASMIPSLAPIIASVIAVYAKTPSSNGHYSNFWSRTCRLVYVPVCLVISMGMMVFECSAIIEGLLSNDATFIRTPKAGKLEEATHTSENDDDDGELISRKNKKNRSILFQEAWYLAAGFSIAVYLIATVFLIEYQIHGTEQNTFDDEKEFSLSRLMHFILLLPAFGLVFVHSSVMREVLSKEVEDWRERMFFGWCLL